MLIGGGASFIGNILSLSGILVRLPMGQRWVLGNPAERLNVSGAIDAQAGASTTVRSFFPAFYLLISGGLIYFSFQKGRIRHG